LIEEAAGKHLAENDLKRMVREGGFYSPIVKVTPASLGWIGMTAAPLHDQKKRAKPLK
jgi:hypothetical protein